MMNLKEVENAKALMREAVNWSVMKWLAEKKKVRKAADVANALLDALDKESEVRMEQRTESRLRRDFIVSEQPRERT